MPRSTVLELAMVSLLTTALGGCGQYFEQTEELEGILPPLPVSEVTPKSTPPHRDETPAVPSQKTAPTVPAKPAPAAHLNYYGGRVIANVKVHAVFWGSGVDPAVKSAMPGFYAALVSSPFMDMLAEYDTNIPALDGTPGTRQHIGRGTFGTSQTITPAVTAKSLTDAQLQAELKAQLSGEHLPEPDANTLYMLHLPPGITVEVNSASSCANFCAYHSTLQRSPQPVHYAVIPYLGAGSGCEATCGIGTLIEKTTALASQQLAEVVISGDTGTAGGSAGSAAAAWCDDAQGQMGDLCGGEQGTLPGTNYAIRAVWSNKASMCVLPGSEPTSTASSAAVKRAK